MRFWFLAFFLPFLVFSQNVDFEGYVLDARTKKPIPYVNISFLNTLKGTSSDEQGHYLLEIPNEFLQKKVHVSSLGYKDAILLASTIQSSKQILMEEETFELDEVVVTEDYSGHLVLNPIGSNAISSGFNSSSTPWVLALYFPNIGAQRKYIEKATIFFRNHPNFKRDTCKFRLRIYGPNPETGNPDEDIMRESLILERSKNDEYISVDLSKYKIKVPREGVYIGLEWLFVPSNWYKKMETDGISKKEYWEDRFAPTFGAVYSKNPNYKVMVYGMGEWTDFTVKSISNDEKLIPAISLKVSK